ncbi:MAG: magnesium/cobalt transporter CorA [Rhodocyclaceae bacterium]
MHLFSHKRHKATPDKEAAPDLLTTALQEHKIGMDPGSIQHVGQVKVRQAAITLFDYDPQQLIEITFSSLEESRKYEKQNGLYWLNVHGLHDASVMQEIGQRFGLHPLVLEDIVNTHHRPKLEDYGDYLFLVLKSFDYNSADRDCQAEQISLVMGADFILSFQERSTGLFDAVRERLRKNNSLLRRGGPDSLLHALTDTIVDSYFVVTEKLSADIEKLEDLLIVDPPRNAVEQINHLKREMYELRHSIWPTREVTNGVLRNTAGLVKPDTIPYFRDVYEHCVHLIEQLDALRDQIGDLLDLYLSTVSNRLNKELRLLTIITTLFAPATIVTGFFGMNFEHLPWTKSENGWLWAAAIIAGGALGLLGLLRWRYRRIRRGF